jgi:D-arabinose 1-dehydrogenase-like Zn-dependent alcohol dehydrogenase
VSPCSPAPRPPACQKAGSLATSAARQQPVLQGCHALTVHVLSCVSSDRHLPTPPRRSVLGIICRDGALAEYTVLPAANLHRVPESLSDAEAAFAEPLAAACRVAEQGLPRRPSEDRVAVIGDGKLGLLVAQVRAAQSGIHAHLRLGLVLSPSALQFKCTACRGQRARCCTQGIHAV